MKKIWWDVLFEFIGFGFLELFKNYNEILVNNIVNKNINKMFKLLKGLEFLFN